MQKALFGQCNGDSWNDFESRTCSDVVLFSWYQNERGEVEEGKTQRHDAMMRRPPSASVQLHQRPTKKSVHVQESVGMF